jgi:hypothetical protein
MVLDILVRESVQLFNDADCTGTNGFNGTNNGIKNGTYGTNGAQTGTAPITGKAFDPLSVT